MTKLQELIDIANKEYDGHFTLMKFTTDWGCCFGTIYDGLESYYMAHGKTMEEAIENCIKNKIDIYKIDASIKAHDILISDLDMRINHGTKYLNHIKPTEYNNYSKRLYRFLNEYPDYRFVQISENVESLKEAIFTIDPMFIFKDSFSDKGKNKLGKDGYLDGFSLETVITPKKQFTKRRFMIKSEPYIVKNISFEFWINYILHGETLFE